MKMKFYQCTVCGQIVVVVKDTKVPLVCCGREMSELIPGSIDASHEKHVPVISADGDSVRVTIGSEPHPMGKEHFIEWIMLETNCGCQQKVLKPGDDPKTCFRICDEENVRAAYTYCNLHGLWKTELPCAR